MSILGNLDTRDNAPLAEDPKGGEVEPTLIPTLSPTPARLGLYGEYGARQESHAVEIAETANLKAIKEATLDEKILAAIQVQREFRLHVPLWVSGNGASGNRRMQEFPFPGQWILETVVGWADANASADFAVNMTLDQSLPVAFSFPVSKTDITSRPIGLPVTDSDAISWVTNGGLAADRAVVILVFKRGS